MLAGVVEAGARILVGFHHEDVGAVVVEAVLAAQDSFCVFIKLSLQIKYADALRVLKLRLGLEIEVRLCVLVLLILALGELLEVLLTLPVSSALTAGGAVSAPQNWPREVHVVLPRFRPPLLVALCARYRVGVKHSLIHQFLLLYVVFCGDHLPRLVVFEQGHSRAAQRRRALALPYEVLQAVHLARRWLPAAALARAFSLLAIYW